MKNINWQKWLGFLCPLIFIALSIAYFRPVLLDQKLAQNDIINYIGGAKELKDFRAQSVEETYWTNSMFGGMPTYQLGAKYKNDFIAKLHRFLQPIPRPASFLFLLLTGFFILSWTLTKRWDYALMGSLFFAFSSYFFIITEAGHNSKVQAIAYFAPLTAGILLLYRKKYFTGFVLTTIFMALEVYTNHVQMTYYLFLGMLVYIPFQLYESIKKREISSFIIASSTAVFAVLLALLMNSGRLYTTYEYNKETIRGKSALIQEEKTSSGEGLTYDYITAWSYGVLETFNLMVPNFMGGKTSSEASQLKNFRREASAQFKSQEEANRVYSYLTPSTYWGDQPFTSGPAYQGAVVVFLFFLGLIVVPGKHKWWLLTATFLSFLLAWGKNIPSITHFLVDYFPLYDKFRAVSSALVIAEFAIPILSLLAVFYFLKDSPSESKKKSLLIAGGGTLLLLMVFYAFGPVLFSFLSQSETLALQNPGTSPVIYSLAEALKKDRIFVFRQDVLRSLLFVSLVVAALAVYTFGVLKRKDVVLVALGLLSLTDLWGVNKRYLNDDNFVKSYILDEAFPTKATPELKSLAQKNSVTSRMFSTLPINSELAKIKEQDPSVYRVFNTILSPFNETNTSYFHHSIGGYHGAKLRSIQDLADQYLSVKINFEVLNMLNTKYILLNEGGINTITNPEANGNAWFVENLKITANDKAEFLALDSVNTKKTALVSSDVDLKSSDFQSADSTQSIQLIQYKPNHLTYEVNSNKKGLAVFSEIYYPKGWKAYISPSAGEKEKAIDILPVNYLLRGALLPKGSYFVDFYFDPDEVKIGNRLNLIFHVIAFISILIALFFAYRKKEFQFSETSEND